ncbi:MAG: PIG-L deacetylase family protein [Candidatus Eisenbacteria bacterium]
MFAPEGERLADELRAAGFDPEVAQVDRALAAPPASLDGALIAGALERTEWDRWLLQQVRRALKPQAPLVLRVPNLWSLASPADVAELAGRVARELGARAQRAGGSVRGGASTKPRPFRGRRYRASGLRAMLERLGFDVERCEGTPYGASWLVVARAGTRGVFGGSVPLGPCAERAAAFEREHAAFAEARDAWAARHPGDAPRSVETLDPAAYTGANVLVLAPHPDDEVIGCGGTLLQLVRAGANVTCVQATDGSDGWALRDLPEAARRSVRMDESRAVAQAAGFSRLECWDADNRAFHRTDALVDRLASQLARLAPRLVFTPFLTDAHADHFTLNRILADAIPRAGEALAECRVLGYEVWSLAPAAVVCDVTAVREEQEALLWIYESGMKVDDFVELCERRNYSNSCRLLGRPGYAEAFHTCAAADYPALVASDQASPTASV